MTSRSMLTEDVGAHSHRAIWGYGTAFGMPGCTPPARATADRRGSSECVVLEAGQHLACEQLEHALRPQRERTGSQIADQVLRAQARGCAQAREDFIRSANQVLLLHFFGGPARG